jgi:hypothetical protein
MMKKKVFGEPQCSSGGGGGGGRRRSGGGLRSRERGGGDLESFGMKNKMTRSGLLFIGSKISITVL